MAMRVLAMIIITLGVAAIALARWQHATGLPHLTEMQALSWWWKNWAFGGLAVIGGLWMFVKGD